MAQGLESAVCPKCGQQIASSSFFCPRCGPRLSTPVEAHPTNACPSCGSSVQQGSLFCPGCGMRLPQTYAPTRKKSSFALVAIIAVLLAALIILAAFTSVLSGSMGGGRGIPSAHNGPSPITPIDNSSSASIGHTFSWVFNGYLYTWNISVDRNQYAQYRNDGIQRSIIYTTQMDLVKSFVTPRDQYITLIAKALNDSATGNGLNQAEEINYILAFVQSIPYSTDINSTGWNDYYRFPVETLCDNTGDCEDKSFLFASITDALHIPTALVLFDDHMGVGVACSQAYGTYYEEGGTEYFYCETTDSGWELGSCPSDYDKAYVIPVA